MDFQKLAELFEELEGTASGNKMREILSLFFKKVPPEDMAMVAYLTLGQIASEYENVVLGMAEMSVLKAISTASGMELSKVKKLMQETGDVGLTAEKVLQKKPQTLVPLGKLTVQELFQKLHKITTLTGAGSSEAKTNTLAALLQKATAKGAKYLTRIALGTLRMGVGDMTVLDALALAYTGEKKNKELLERAYNICPDVGIIAETIAKKGLSGIEKIEAKVGRPIKMMLAQRVKALEEITEKIPGNFAVEGKYDGERVQAHKTKGKITLFSRRLDDTTSQFPDIVEYLAKCLAAREFIVEGEIVAVGEKGKYAAFQVLMQRRRKENISEYVKKVPVELKIFDLLYLNGQSLIDKPYHERIEKLKKILTKNKQITLADRIDTDDLQELNEFFKKMLDIGHEGVIVKDPNSPYLAGTRGWNWIKWKKEYEKEMIDTFDLVIVGAYHGKGKRSGTYGALLCASYNKKEDTFETVCKLGTGLTDEVLNELPKMLSKHKVNKKPGRVVINKEMEPEVWFEPALVVEVLAAEITKSPYHSLGLALRFPRFVRFREKKAEQATTSKEIKEMYG